MRHLRFSITVAFFMLACLSIHAQTPLARFVLPTNTTETAVQPTFRIITRYRIDTTSVHWNWQFDSTHRIRPILCAIPQRVYGSLGDSVWPRYARKGTGTVVNDTTLEFQSDPLVFGRAYEAILVGLRVIDTSGDTVTIPDTVARMAFTTVNLPPRVLSISCMSGGGFVLKHDTISAHMSLKLDSANGGSGPLLSLLAPIVRYDSTGDSMITYDSSISASSWLDPSDSSVIHILPTGTFVPGMHYKILMNLSGLTGDTTQDFSAGFYSRKTYQLNIIPAAVDGLLHLDTVHFEPRINELCRLINDSTMIWDSCHVGRIVNAGDTITYQAPTRVSAAKFKQWSSPGNPTIDGSTNPLLTFSLGPDQLHDVNVIAQYKPAPKDTVCVAVSGLNCAAWSCDFIETRSLQDGQPNILDTCYTNCSYPIEEGKEVSLQAVTPSDTIMFDHWSSADTTINGSHRSVLFFKANQNICATAAFVHVPPNPPVFPTSLCAYVDLNGQPAPGTIAIITSPVAPPCSTDVSVYSLSATLKILSPDYGLKAYVIDDQAAGIHIYHDCSGGHPVPSVDFPMDLSGAGALPYPHPGGGFFTPPEATQLDYPPGTQITFYIEKITRVLEVYIKMDGHYLPNGSDLTFVASDQDKMWCYDDTKGIYTLYNTERRSAGGGGFEWWHRYYIYYESGSTPTLTCGANKGYSWLRWDVNDPYGNPNTDYASTPALGPLTMDRNRVVTAIFHAPFELESISYYQWGGPATGIDPTNRAVQDPWAGNPSGHPVWQTFLVDDWDNNQDHTSNTQMRAWAYGLWAGSSTTWSGRAAGYDADEQAYIAPEGPHVVLHFNKQIQPQVGHSADVLLSETTAPFWRSSSNLMMNATRVWIGSDFNSLPWDNAVATGQDLELSLTTSTPGEDAHHIMAGYKVRVPGNCCPVDGIAVWKGQAITIDVRSNFKSLSGEPLSNPKSFTLHTEDPDITWTYTNGHLGDSPLDCLCASYYAWTDIFAVTYPEPTPPGASKPLGPDQTYADVTGICKSCGQNDDMGAHSYRSKPTGNSGADDENSNWANPSEQTLAAVSHCWYQRQFEAAVQVHGGVESSPWYCPCSSDPNGSVLLDWSDSYDDMKGFALDVPFWENDLSNGYRDHLQTILPQNENMGGGNSDFMYDFGDVHFDISSVDHSIDWWGAAPGYGDAHSDNGARWHQWSNGSNGGFRADFRVDIR